jgi:hypothetical protein
MSRSFTVPGECLIQVKGPSGSAIAGITQLALAEDQVRVTIVPKYRDIACDAWGAGNVPPDVQTMLAEVQIQTNLVHFDQAVLSECQRLSMGGPGAEGQTARAGTLMGNGLPRFSEGNSYIGLNLSSPVQNFPWRFLYCYITSPQWPMGVEAAVVPVTWRCVPYTVDPWNNGLGATNYTLWDHALDT